MTKAKHPPKTPDILSRNIEEFSSAINHENDLACVLVTVNYLDQCLASLLRKFFRKSSQTCDRIFDPPQPLGNFYARSTIAYCLDLINAGMYSNLNHIGDIRNLFAHSHPELTFNDEEVKRICSLLTFPTIQDIEVSVEETRRDGSVTDKLMTREEFERTYQEPKRRFTAIAGQLGLVILIFAHMVRCCEDFDKLSAS